HNADTVSIQFFTDSALLIPLPGIPLQAEVRRGVWQAKWPASVPAGTTELWVVATPSLAGVNGSMTLLDGTPVASVHIILINDLAQPLGAISISSSSIYSQIYTSGTKVGVQLRARGVGGNNITGVKRV